jgi:hypothetical protein
LEITNLENVMVDNLLPQCDPDDDDIGGNDWETA